VPPASDTPGEARGPRDANPAGPLPSRAVAVNRRRAAKRMMVVHLCAAIVWLLLLVPTLLWWKNSILWVASMSLYANVAAHLSGFQGARAERSAEN
jgi:hypothetical protein